MDDIKPKLDEDAQEVLTSLADSSKAADDDAELLYEATKVRPTNLDCLYLFAQSVQAVVVQIVRTNREHR